MGLRNLIDARRRELEELPQRGDYAEEFTNATAAKAALHGTEAGYSRGCRCAECRSAAAAGRRERRHRNGVRTHGTHGGYANGCRCDPCRDANSRYRKAKRASDKDHAGEEEAILLELREREADSLGDAIDEGRLEIEWTGDGPVAHVTPREEAPKTAKNPWTDEELIAELQADAERLGRPPTSSEWRLHTPSTDRVVKRFGSWNEGLEAAGMEPRKQGERLNRDRRRPRRVDGVPVSTEQAKVDLLDLERLRDEEVRRLLREGRDDEAEQRERLYTRRIERIRAAARHADEGARPPSVGDEPTVRALLDAVDAMSLALRSVLDAGEAA